MGSHNQSKKQNCHIPRKFGMNTYMKGEVMIAQSCIHMLPLEVRPGPKLTDPKNSYETVPNIGNPEYKSLFFMTS